MPDFLLLGAGFSRTWGGWLASEAFEYLLGDPEVVRSAELRKLLWRYQNDGGFEAALAYLQQAHILNHRSNASALLALQAAITRMFADMNKAFLELADWEFQNNRDQKVGAFLTRFDAIFTLNQDVLLEQHYTTDNVSLVGARRWDGVELPGMRRIPPIVAMHSNSWAHSTWSPLPEPEFKVSPRCQPLFKLHGSSNWRHPDGRDMLVIGGGKIGEISQTPILNWYAEIFDERVCLPDARLMVIGYGFRDAHINASIAKAVERGLKLFVIAPQGAELAKQINPTRQPGLIAARSPLEDMLEAALIGASRRTLQEIFGGDLAEHNKVMRFFES
jgi:hypothetical protein